MSHAVAEKGPKNVRQGACSTCAPTNAEDDGCERTDKDKHSLGAEGAYLLGAADPKLFTGAEPRAASRPKAP